MSGETFAPEGAENYVAGHGVEVDSEPSLLQDIREGRVGDQDALNRFFSLVPDDTEHTSETLKEQGWKEVFSYRPFKPNGGVNMGDIELACEELQKHVPRSIATKEVIQARAGVGGKDGLPEAARSEESHIRIILVRDLDQEIVNGVN